MALDEVVITRAIVSRYLEKFLDCIRTETAVVGGGPSGLVAACFLARAGRRVVLFERKLGIGGGMWGGGMLFNEIVVQEEARGLLESFGVRTRRFEEGYSTADAVETVGALAYHAVQAGVRILNGVSVEDVVVREGRVIGLVINWSAVQVAGLHVDPLTVHADWVVDATGHDSEVLAVIERKAGIRLLTATGKRLGEQSMWAERAEQLTVENTREICPGVYVAGMAVNACFGGPRMGPIFGGMLLSGRRAAELILSRLEPTREVRP